MSFKANLTGNMAYQAQLKGDNEKAKTLYEEALAAGMNRPDLVDAYGVLLMKEGQFEASIEIYGKALALNPAPSQRHTIRVHRSIAYMKIGKMNKAKAALEDIHQKQETESTFETLGYLYILTDDEKARTFNEEAINMYPDNVTILDNIGQYYLGKGYPQYAKEFLEDAYKINDEKADVNFHLAQVAQMEGDKKKAVEYLNKAKNCPMSALTDTRPEDIDNLLDKLLN
jgi:Tfp pilus assembly protein PilF